MDEDDNDAALAQIQLEERQQQEEALRLHGVLLNLFRREQAQFAREMGREREAQWWERRAS